MGGIVNKRRRSVYPILLQRQQLADSFSRHLDRLGIERLPKPVPLLADLEPDAPLQREKIEARVILELAGVQIDGAPE